jgi:sirohydrochlorin ferrochelatase
VTAPLVFLTDNGSLAPDATLSLRRIAAALAQETGVAVEPVSLLHSSAVPAEKLDGRRAEIFEPALTHRAEAGARRFLILPLFFGPTRAISSYLPERTALLTAKFPGLEIQSAPWLVRLPGDGSEALAGAQPLAPAGDGAEEILDILERQARAVLARRPGARVALVDHGSPEPRVTRVRNFLAQGLCHRLVGIAASVRPCSMERREGDAYAFNEPLLEHLLRSADHRAAQVVVSMLFLQPGRHAGPSGDVATICAEAEAACPGLRTETTALVGEDPALIPLLARRLRDALGA